MHETLIFFCFVIFEECIYEWMKVCFFFIIFEEWMYKIRFSFEERILKCMKMHVWMYEILFFIFLDDNAYIKSWNSIFHFYFLEW